MARAGREFELLVKRLEAGLAPAGAKVTSPDYLWDHLAKKRREVDVTIRMPVGSVEIIVMLECRDREGAEDVTWIEQLAQKRNNLAASKAVAISSDSFTDGARNTASALGIDLRTIAEVDAEVVQEWLRVYRVTVTRPNFEIHWFEPTLHATPETVSSLASALKSLKGGPSNVFLWGDDPTQKNPQQLFSLLSAQGWMSQVKPDPWKGLPDDGSRLQRKLAIDVTGLRPPIRLSWNGVEAKVDVLRFVVDLWQFKEEVPLTRMISYRKDQEAFVEAAEYLQEVEGLLEIWTIQRNLETGEESFSRAPAEGDRELPTIWMKFSAYPINPP